MSRLESRGWLGGAIACAVVSLGLPSCVGSDPTEGAANGDGGGTLDGADSEPSNPDLVFEPKPATVIRGGTGEVSVTLRPLSDSSRHFTLQLAGGPSGFVAGPIQPVLVGQGEIRLPFSTDPSVPYGAAQLQVVASEVGSTSTSSVPVALFVRGQRGTLDTRYGDQGSTTAPPESKLHDAALDDQERVLAVGDEPVAVARYDANGQLDPAFDGGVQTSAKPAWVAEWNEVGFLSKGEDGTHQLALLGKRTDPSSNAFAWIRWDEAGVATAQPVALPTGSYSRFGTEGLGVFHRGLLFFSLSNSFTPNGTTQVKARLTAFDEQSIVSPAYNSVGRVEYEEPNGPYRILRRSFGNDYLVTVGLNRLHAPPAPDYDRYDVRVASLVTGIVHQEIVGTEQPPGTTARVYGLTELASDGAFAAIRSTSSAPCVIRFRSNGSLEPDMAADACARIDGADNRESGGVLLPDGRLVVVAVGAITTLWVSDEAGHFGDGISLLDASAGPTTKLVRVLPLSHDRVLVMTTTSGGARWSIRCYWL